MDGKENITRLYGGPNQATDINLDPACTLHTPIGDQVSRDLVFDRSNARCLFLMHAALHWSIGRGRYLTWQQSRPSMPRPWKRNATTSWIDCRWLPPLFRCLWHQLTDSCSDCGNRSHEHLSRVVRENIDSNNLWSYRSSIGNVATMERDNNFFSVIFWFIEDDDIVVN